MTQARGCSGTPAAGGASYCSLSCTNNTTQLPARCGQVTWRVTLCALQRGTMGGSLSVCFLLFAPVYYWGLLLVFLFLKRAPPSYLSGTVTGKL